MAWFDDLNKLTFDRAVQIACIVFGNIIAPAWFLFQYRYSLFDSLDFSKLILISIAIGFPITFLQSLVDLHKIFREEDDKRRDTFFSVFTKDSIFTATLFYLPCCWYYFDNHVKLHDAITACIGMGLGSIVAKIGMSIKANYDRKKKSTKQSGNELKAQD